MKQFIINVPDDKRTFFEELMRNLDFAITENAIVSEATPEWHKEIVLDRVDKAGDEDYLPWDEARKTIKKKGA